MKKMLLNYLDTRNKKIIAGISVVAVILASTLGIYALTKDNLPDFVLSNSKTIKLEYGDKYSVNGMKLLNTEGMDDKDKKILNKINIHAKKGETIAIVGPTGAGKTTIIKLLMRFYDVNSGAIYVDGKNIKDYNRQELRSHFGMVLQDTWLFSGSIKDNIKYGKLDATDEQVKQAAKAAHVDHFIKTLPSGYDMVLNEEASNVSQGQKQLLTIARAILADPEILILDEATSSVDTRTEVLIQKAMDNLMENRTSFIIAHRLSTIRNADLILVMKDGDIIEQGTHEELLAQDGFYTNLYNSQFDNDEDQEQAV